MRASGMIGQSLGPEYFFPKLQLLATGGRSERGAWKRERIPTPVSERRDLAEAFGDRRGLGCRGRR